MPLVSCPKCDYEFDSRVASCPKCGEVVTTFVRQHAGTLVDGKYRVLKRLGRGGMGEVFKVEHVHLGTTRVIKVMRPQIADEKELQDRFVREARLATLIQHPNVATLHDFSILPDKSCYMVWEYIDGTDLGTFSKSGALDTGLTIQLVIQALRGLEAIHNAGIVHRDISPENIMVSATSSTGIVAKVIDLGIAKSDSADGSLTSTGVFIGKWRYASPEHLGLLDSGEKIDGRADLFSMGIVLYELLAGKLPFEAETPGQYILLHAGDKPSPVTPDRISVPDAPGLEIVLARLLQRDRAKRHANAAELIADLERVLAAMRPGDDAPPTMVLTPRPTPEQEAETVPTTSPAPTVQTAAGISASSSSSRALMIGASIAAILAVVIGILLVAFVLRMKRPEDIQPRAGLTAATATPAGELVDIPAAAPAESGRTDTVEPEPVDPSPPAAEATPTEEPEEPPPAKPTEATTVPAPTAPPKQTPAPAETPSTAPEKTPSPAQEPSAPAPPTPRTDTIPTSGKPMFGWRSKKLVDDPSYKSGFRRGIIRDYSDMWSRGGLDWVSVARGVRLADHRIKVSKFRNMTEYSDDAMTRYLDVVLQTELDEVTESGGALTTENAIFWAQVTPEFGIGIEMIFRDSSGRVVAKIRHVHFEDSLEDAAQEMVDYIVEFVEDQEEIE